MRNALILICCLGLLWPAAVTAAERAPAGRGAAMTPGEAAWYQSLRAGLSQFRKGGGYKTNREAMEALAQKTCRWDPRTRRPVFLLREATPSFCSSACYLLLLKSLQLWDAAQPQPVISERAWLALIPRLGQHDGEGPWGWANANGPGLAVLVHRLGAGVNFEDWRKARPGDFMKIFWTDHIGRRESGHLTVLVKDGGDTVTFWSSNMPDGYGAKTVPKSANQARHLHAHHQAGAVQPGSGGGKPSVALLPAPAGGGHQGGAQILRHAEPVTSSRREEMLLPSLRHAGMLRAGARLPAGG